MKKENICNLLIFLGVFFLDRLAKILLNEGCLGIFCIRTVLNEGASFGILMGMLPLFIVVSSAVLVLIVHFYDRVNSRIRLAFAFLAAGTLGNLLDRIFFGGVIDKFAIWQSSSFNVADLSNVIGGAIIIYALFYDGKSRHS
jgi:signal peptidase II